MKQGFCTRKTRNKRFVGHISSRLKDLVHIRGHVVAFLEKQQALVASVRWQ